MLASKTVPHLPPGVPALPAESQYTLSFVIAGIALALVGVVSWFGLRHIRVAAHHAEVARNVPAGRTDAGAGQADAGTQDTGVGAGRD